ncbi:MAG: transposase [Muribaculaceae bacterium]|nr:transposase [Muribaculaceae bacterium]
MGKGVPDERNAERLQWWLTHGQPAVRYSMMRRRAGHDYRGRCIYMVTLCVDGRRPVLGELRGPDAEHNAAWVRLSPLGERVGQCWHAIPGHYPQVRVLALQLMPDHLHGILFVTESMPRHLGQVVNGFKKGCNDAMRELSAYCGPSACNAARLWMDGYNDCILDQRGQLDVWFNYLHDNPRRLWQKRNHPEWFTSRHRITINAVNVTVMSNQYLLRAPERVAVQYTRRLTEGEIERLGDQLLQRALDGAVLVSPCISPGEKAIMRRAFDAGLPAIVLVENGFSPLGKPSGRMFDACAEERVLIVAPWEHHNERRAITREQCLQLNALAKAICEHTDQWPAIDGCADRTNDLKINN